MAYKYSGDKHSVAWLVQNFSDGKLDTTISIQRREVWTPQMKSNLISSLIIGIPINPILLEESIKGEENYFVIDGKQRTLTISEFVGGFFKLSKGMRYPNYDGFDYIDKKFEDLPDRIKDRIRDRELQFIVNRPLEEDEREKLFYLWNQAAPLSPAELLRAGLGEQIMDKVQALTEHEFMIDKVKITKPARKKYEDFQQLILYAMLQRAYDSNSEIGFSKQEITTFCDDLKITPALLDDDRINDILNYLDEAFPHKQEYLKKANLPMILLVANLALKDKASPSDFFEWADNLFKQLAVDPEYQKLCKSYKRGDVQGRMTVILDSAKAELLGKKRGRRATRKKESLVIEETAAALEEVHVPIEEAETVEIPEDADI